MSPIGRLNYLNVGPGGTFAASGKFQSAPQDVDDLVAHLAARPAKRIVVHLHGGLVNEAAGMAVAEKMIPVYEAAGSHALGIVWETGFLETMRDNLGDVARTKLFRKLLKLVLRLVLPHLDVVPGARGLGPTPTEGEIDAQLARGVPFAAWDAGVPSPGAKAAGPPTEGMLAMQAQMLLQGEPALDPDADGSPKMDVRKVADAPAAPGGKGLITAARLAVAAGKIAWRVLRRMLGGHGHGLYPTTMEEILREVLLADFGNAVWGAMKKKAFAMFEDADAQGPRAGTVLVEKLAALQKAAPELVVDVVGHSAGSIATAALLARAEKAGLRIRKIAFLAPAVRLDVFAREIVPRHGPGKTFAQFRAYTMDDDFEVQDHLAGPVYTRSLLYLISGILEDDDGDTPIAGLERHVQGAPPYVGGDFDTVHTFLYAPGKNRLVRSRTSVYTPGAADDLRTESEHHGDFDDDDATRTSLTRYLTLDVPV